MASTLFWLVLVGLGALTGAPHARGAADHADLRPRRPRGAGDRPLAGALPDRPRCSASRGSSSGSSTATSSSRSRRSCRSLWNLAIIVALVFGVPRFESEDGPALRLRGRRSSSGRSSSCSCRLPWLRGPRRPPPRRRSTGAIPAVRRVFVLMLPVTLGARAHQLQRSSSTRSSRRDSSTRSSRRARSTPPFASTCSRRGCSRSRSRPCSSPRSSRLAARGDSAASASTVVARPAPDRLPAPPGERRSRRCSPSRSSASLYERGEFTPDQTPVVAGALAAFSLGLTFNGTMLMLNRAFFSLQSPWMPTAVALGNLGAQRRPRRRLLPPRHLGDPARDVARQHRRDGGAARRLRDVARADSSGRVRSTSYARITPPRPCSPRASPSASGTGSTRSLGRSLGGADRVASAAALLAAAARLPRCRPRLLGVRELDALLSLAAPRPATARLTMAASTRIRNFSIVAHIDHGKSTLADRILEVTETVSGREMREQVLDSMELERERGITIKAQAVRVLWNGHQLNLIDTPGHVDFTYEVSRALQACEGALLVVDAAQGIEAQTLANAYLAIENDLEIVPVVNKIDLPQADPDGAARRDRRARRRGARPRARASPPRRARASRTSSTPSSSGSRRRQATRTRRPRALVFDSSYDQYRGVVAFVRMVDGRFRHARAAARDGGGNALRGRGARLLLARPPPRRRSRRARSATSSPGSRTSAGFASATRSPRGAARPPSRSRATRT